MAPRWLPDGSNGTQMAQMAPQFDQYLNYFGQPIQFRYIILSELDLASASAPNWLPNGSQITSNGSQMAPKLAFPSWPFPPPSQNTKSYICKSGPPPPPDWMERSSGNLRLPLKREG